MADETNGRTSQPAIPKVALQEYVDARFDGVERAVETADSEREKAASALREGLLQSIDEGDLRLTDHVKAQVENIKAALASADLLERERIALVRAEVESLEGTVTGLFSDMQERLAAARRELEQATAAQKEAVLKAENANEKRFQSIEEAKVATAERDRANAESHQKQIGALMPRELAESQTAANKASADQHYADNLARINSLQHRLDTQTGNAEGRERLADTTRADATLVTQNATLAAQVKGLYYGLFGAVFLSTIGFVASVITHGFH